MKPFTTNFLISIYNFNKPLLCSKKSLKPLSSLWRWCLSLVRAGRDLVRLVQKNGPIAVQAHLNEGRYVIGDLFLLMGAGSIFFYQLFPEPGGDPSWYYQNWFYFFYTLRLWMVIVFGSLSIFCYWPKHHVPSVVVFIVLQAIGWSGVVHYSLFVYDYDSYHSFPVWYAIVMALSFGLAFFICSDYMVHRYNHWIRGNQMRFVGIGESTKMTAEEKGKLAELLAKEYRKLEVRI